MKPIFLISLPRSGSTLLQRLLATHPDIATISEPWIWLPIIYSTKAEGTLAEYSHRNSQLGLNHLIEKLPEGKAQYLSKMRLSVDALYEELCTKNEQYFLDKTPRYHLVLKELTSTYPDAKYIFLTRNPMDRLASVVKTFGDNKLSNFHNALIDEGGWENIADGLSYTDKNHVSVTYEDLVSNPTAVIMKILNYLGLNTQSFSIEPTLLSGSVGDQPNQAYAKRVSNSSIGNWKNTFYTKQRKSFLKARINDISAESLAAFGYKKQALLNAIDTYKTPLPFKFGDLMAIPFHKLAVYLNGHMLFTKPFKWTRRKYLS